MNVIDPHIHLWDLATHRYPWMESDAEGFLGDTRPLKKTYLVADLLADAGDAVEIEAVVHIEGNHDPADPVEETRWLSNLAADPANRGLPQAIVAAADLSSDGLEAVLEAHAAFSGVRGIRQILNVHPDPRYDYVGRHYMRDPKWQRHFGLLARYGMSFDLQIYPSQMAEAVELARRHPDIPIIVNHTGMFVDRGRPCAWREWRDGMRGLAACPQVVVKISGLAMLDHDWTIESIRPYALEAIDAFGVKRAMFASNFPVDRLFGSYARVWQAFDAVVADASAAERDALFRSTARRVYRIAREMVNAVE